MRVISPAGLRQYLSKQIALVAAVPMALLLLLGALIGYPLAGRDVEEQQRVIANAIASELAAHLQAAELVLSNLSEVQVRRADEGAAVSNQLLDAQLRNSDVFEALYFIDAAGKVAYVQVVPELTHEPDYAAVLDAVKKLV